MPTNYGGYGANGYGMGGYQNSQPQMQYMQSGGFGQQQPQMYSYGGQGAGSSYWQPRYNDTSSQGNGNQQAQQAMFAQTINMVNMMAAMMQQFMQMFMGGGQQQQSGQGQSQGQGQGNILGNLGLGNLLGAGGFNNISFDGMNNGGSNFGVINNGAGAGYGFPQNNGGTVINNPGGNPSNGQWINNGNGFSNISFDGTNNGGINIGIINNWNQPSGNSAADKQPPTPVYNGGKQAKFWGDPHLEGFDGEKYDVQGANNKFYDMLSDQNVQYNTKFESWGSGGATVVTQAGIQVGNDKVYYDRTMASPTVNGIAMQIPSGQNQVTAALDNGGSAIWNGTLLTVNTGEYSIGLEKKKNEANGDYLDSTIKINEGGPYKDLVAPQGLLGQTADNVPGQKNTGVDQGKQGGTVITGTVADYEVNGIWGTNDKNNRFGDQVAQTTLDNKGNVVQTTDKDGTVLFKQVPQTTTA
jgi:hypothetical protein